MAEAMTVAEQEKSPERLLIEAERKMKKLEAKMAAQQKTIRELRSQIRQDDNLAERISDLKAEVDELKGEIKEVTRANHDYVARFEALRDELAKSKVDVRRSGKSMPATKTPVKSGLEAVVA
jgi:predicted  nucleic acid-binding Zn-ribbon protein